AVLEGALFTFYDIAQGASLPRVVTAEQLPAALARSHGMVGTAELLGPPLGGVLYQLARPLPFLVDAASYLVSAASLLFIRTAFQQQRSESRRRLRVEILEVNSVFELAELGADAIALALTGLLLQAL